MQTSPFRETTPRTLRVPLETTENSFPEGKKYRKDPDARLDYTWDWSEWLVNDRIASATITAEAGITIVESSVSEDKQSVIVILESGEIGKTYHVQCRIVTLAGRTDDRTVRVEVNQK